MESSASIIRLPDDDKLERGHDVQSLGACTERRGVRALLLSGPRVNSGCPSDRAHRRRGEQATGVWSG